MSLADELREWAPNLEGTHTKELLERAAEELDALRAPARITFVSEGGSVPAGEYLVQVWRESDPALWSLAYRPAPEQRIVWGPPLPGEVR